MAFWIFVLAMDLLVPGVMIGFGKEFQKNPPTEINPGYGYRTAMSSKNQDTWDFAQKRMGEVWHKWGKALLIPSFVPLLFVLGRDVGTVGAVGMVICGVQLIVMLSSIGVTEHALRKNFDKDGKRQ
ncbi:MAG: SdpI family protein [Lawsonibacter sp.]|nr:SdpI family protein [Lawsonibacter sp.]